MSTTFTPLHATPAQAELPHGSVPLTQLDSVAGHALAFIEYLSANSTANPYGGDGGGGGEGPGGGAGGFGGEGGVGGVGGEGGGAGQLSVILLPLYET